MRNRSSSSIFAVTGSKFMASMQQPKPGKEETNGVLKHSFVVTRDEAGSDRGNGCRIGATDADKDTDVSSLCDGVSR